MCAKYSDRIRKPVIIAVEGADPFYLLLHKIKDNPEFESVQLFDFGSVESLSLWLETIRLAPDFHLVQALGIIRDAEHDSAAAISSIRHSLKVNQFPDPQAPLEIAEGTHRVSFLLLPHGASRGCLEDSLLSSTSAPENRKCAEKFLRCVDTGNRNDNWRAKVVVHAMIAATEYPSRTLGESASTGLWDFSHPSLAVLLDFIKHLAQTGEALVPKEGALKAP